MSEIYGEFKAIKFQQNGERLEKTEVVKKVIGEISLKIYVNGTELFSILSSNSYQENLAIGVLYNEGLIESIDDVAELNYNERLFAVNVRLKENLSPQRLETLRSLTSGCGRCFTYINPLKKDRFKALADGPKFSLQQIIAGMADFISRSDVHREIGGVHSAMVKGEREYYAEDIGRHNCVDKIAGAILKEKYDPACSVLYLSGRVSSEILLKCLRLKVSTVVSKSPPTSAAVELAQQYNLTLLGYVRGGEGNIYSHPERSTS